MKKLLCFLLPFSLIILSCGSEEAADADAPKETMSQLSPDERFGELFEMVQMGEVFEDSKTFVDCTPRSTTQEILEVFNKQRSAPDFDIKQFVNTHFELPLQHASGFVSDNTRSVDEHINSLWPVLTRQADSATVGSLLPLPKSYIVPGGRFGEIYYWDSYFTILGLEAANQWQMIENMADNFSYLIDEVGFVPNGNRTYYLGRSQPPFYSLIIKVLADGKGKEQLQKYLPQLQKEYDFWMDGLQKVSSDNPTHRRVVRMEDGSILNRYWDDRPQARPESYREDVALAASLDAPKEVTYRHIRAAAESGWDFSSRWFADGQYMASIHTTDIIPVDLNALLYHLEGVLAAAYELEEDEEKANLFAQKMNNRKKALLNFCWNKKEGFFMDYDWVARKNTEVLSLAGMYPLYFSMADTAQALAATDRIEKDFLKPGGVVSTLNETSQQWDAPNGWAPLQWMTIKGLQNYGQQALAGVIADRWIKLNTKVYENTGKMVEKYNVIDMELDAGGGEYPVQDGFGWSNGVLLRLINDTKAATEE